MHTRLITLGALGALVLTGCANMDETGRDTAKGAAAGGAAGAVLGAVVSDNRGKGAMVGGAIGAAAGAIGANIWSKRMQEQKRAMEDATRGTAVAVTQTPNNELKLDIPSDVSFDTGRADIKPEMRPVLDKFAQSLTQHTATNVRIIGHTDNTGSDAINNPLSMERAASARNYLTSRGVTSSRIAIDGRGEREPIADNNTAEGRAKNRRIEVFVAEPETAQAPQPTPATRQ